MLYCSLGLHVNLPSNSLASYHEVTNAFPSDKKLRRIAGKKLDDDEEWREEYDKITGELFKHEFFRVVLDEGHAIRNYKTKSLLCLPPPYLFMSQADKPSPASKACISLSSKYRWILTGTPIHNSIEGICAGSSSCLTIMG